MSITEKLNEEQVFKQEVADDELESVSGGGLLYPYDEDTKNCVNNYERYIYDGGFPNCAATVEDGSQCTTNDACFVEAVCYQGRKSCVQAWK